MSLVCYNTDWQSRVAPETGGNVHRPDCPHQGQAQGQVLMNTPKSTYVYFISVGSGPIKIGLSDDPHSRLATLQTAHYRKLHLLYTLECATREEAFQLETAFHRWYGDVHMMNEWFDATPSQIEADIRLLETLAKSAVQYTAHTPTSTIAKIEERAQERKSNALLGHSKQPQASKIVRDYFQEHPEAIDGNPIEIAAALGVGKSTVYNVIKSMKQ